jgi:flagellin-like hook-associated protein FlgL
MSAIPANLSRVPNLLASRIALTGISGTNRELLRIQTQMSSALQFQRPSENAIGASAVLSLNEILERREQRIRNLGDASSTLNSVDTALGDVTDILQEAKVIGLAQVGTGSDEATRRTQAGVINSMLNSLVGIANRDRNGIHLFGGERTAAEPMVSLLQGLRYTGVGKGKLLDTGLGGDLRVTMGADQAFGALSSRVQGDRDLDPSMTLATRLSSLNGANGLGVRPGSVEIEVNGVVTQTDLSDADSVGDVITRVSAVIQATDPGAVVNIDPATGDRIAVTPSAGFTVVMRDSNSTATAGDLGLRGTYPPGVTTTGLDLNPRITPLTRLDSLTGLSLPLGQIQIRNGNQARIIDLSAVQTVQDFQNAVEVERIGVRVEISEDGTRLNVLNELSGTSMAIEEFSGNATATQLGIRSFSAGTLLSDFNDGRGVRQVTGVVDPITGLPDPARNTDFRVTLKDGRTFDVDIDGSFTVQDVLTRINAAATAAGVLPAEFAAQLVSVGNGIELVDSTVGASTVVFALNGSSAAADLGILGQSTGPSLVGTDTSKVAVDSVFSHMIALRDALIANDTRRIEIAAAKLDEDLIRTASARADIGVRTQRVEDATTREGDLRIQDIALRSEIQDLDYAAAAGRFASLQQQLEAGLAVAARATSLSLLDFLR